MSAPTRARRSPSARVRTAPGTRGTGGGPAKAVAGDPGVAGVVSSVSRGRFAARVRARRWLSLRPVLAFLAVLTLLAGVGWVLLDSPWVAVDEVVVTGESRVSEQEVLAAARVAAGTPLLRVDLAGVEKRVGAIAQVDSVRVHRRWPNRLEVVVAERLAVAAVPDGRAFRLVDADGVLFDTVAKRPAGMPLVDADADGVDSATLQAALDALGALPPAVARRVVSVAARTPDDVVLRLRSRQQVVWGGAGRAERKATVLTALMRAQRWVAVYDVSAPDVPTTRGVIAGAPES